MRPEELAANLQNHVTSLASLLESLIERSSLHELGPADGRLYMQLCDTLNEYAKNLERAFRENNPESQRDSTGGEAPKSESESDKSPDSDA